MAAEQLEKVGRQLGHKIKVETQGSMGIENELTAAEIREADVVVFAADIGVEERQRFDGKKIVEVPVQLAIKDPKAIFAKLGA
jgi:fructose-specific phosphotransferase system IIB component